MAAASTPSPMSSRGVQLLGAMRRNLELLVELEKSAPRDVEEIVLALIAHLRSWKPLAATAVPARIETAPFALVDLAPPAAAGDVTGQLNDGASYELGVIADALWLKLRDHDDDKALVTMTEGQAGAFGRDFARVLARLRDLAKAAR